MTGGGVLTTAAKLRCGDFVPGAVEGLRREVVGVEQRGNAHVYVRFEGGEGVELAALAPIMHWHERGEQVGRNEFGEPQATVQVTIDVTQWMHDRDGADVVAERVVREALGPDGDPTDWQNRFAIVREIKAV